mmetsp:Transcript_39416/g.45860  ORF Transcript_39416/g.45860 Transcript_39416/m.45860 type:complete len:244 (-) Transcript_39416:273-1004(-)
MEQEVVEQNDRNTVQDELFDFPMSKLFLFDTSEKPEETVSDDFCELLQDAVVDGNDIESCTGKSAPEVEEIAVKPEGKNNKIKRKTIQKDVSKAKKDSKKPKKDRKKQSKEAMKETKNVVKNYGKAMAAFSLTELALPYLKPSLQNHRVTLDEFKKYIINKKESIDSISSLREAIVGNPEYDSPQEMKLKAVFRDICEVFIQDFAMNWIFSCRSQYKSALISYRFKLLRRVRDPAAFTYLKPQ